MDEAIKYLLTISSLVIILLIQACTFTIEGITKYEADGLHSYMIAQFDVTCSNFGVTVSVPKGTKLKMLDLGGRAYNGPENENKLPQHTVLLNINAPLATEGPVVFPDGNFVFNNSHYGRYEPDAGGGDGSVLMWNNPCKFEGSGPPFKMIINK